MTSAPPVQEDKALRQRMRQLNDMLEQVQEIVDPKARDTTIKILDTMMEFHAAGLQKILERLATVPRAPPPGTVYIGSEMQGTTLSQYGVTGLRLWSGSTVTRYST